MNLADLKIRNAPGNDGIKRLSNVACELRKHCVSIRAHDSPKCPHRLLRSRRSPFSRNHCQPSFSQPLRYIRALLPRHPGSSSLSRFHPRIPWHLPTVPLRETKMVTASALQRRFIPRPSLYHRYTYSCGDTVCQDTVSTFDRSLRKEGSF